MVQVIGKKGGVSLNKFSSFENVFSFTARIPQVLESFDVGRWQLINHGNSGNNYFVRIRDRNGPTLIGASFEYDIRALFEYSGGTNNSQALFQCSTGGIISDFEDVSNRASGGGNVCNFPAARVSGSFSFRGLTNEAGTLVDLRAKGKNFFSGIPVGLCLLDVRVKGIFGFTADGGNVVYQDPQNCFIKRLK